MIAILAAVCLLVVKIVLAALDKVMKIIPTFAEKTTLTHSRRVAAIFKMMR